jgi:hypothetical protein
VNYGNGITIATAATDGIDESNSDLVIFFGIVTHNVRFIFDYGLRNSYANNSMHLLE